MGSSIFLITAKIRIKTAVANPLAKRGNYDNIPPMSNDNNKRPPVPGGPAIPGYGGDYDYGGAAGAKNLRWRFGCHLRRLDLATYNARTLRADEKIVELEEVIDKLRWHIIRLSEVRREGEDTVILESGNLLYHRESDHLSQGGVGFIVHKSLVNNVVKIESVSIRVAYLILRITKWYSLKVIQVYVPTMRRGRKCIRISLEPCIHPKPVLMEDFNAKLGTRENGELKVGKFGIGQLNPRDQQPTRSTLWRKRNYL